MQTYVPKTINKCWTHHSVDKNVIIKSCDVTMQNPKNNTEERRIIKSDPMSGQNTLFESMFVKQCDPKKDKTCAIQIGASFFKQCDPKKDKTCKLSLDGMLFG